MFESIVQKHSYSIVTLPVGGNVEKLVEQNSTLAMLSRDLDMQPLPTTDPVPSISMSEAVSETRGSISTNSEVVNEAIEGMNVSDDAWLDEVIDEAVEQQLVEDHIDLTDIMDGADLFEDEDQVV